MSGGCNIRFDENDDVVIDDIPDDLMVAIERRAEINGRSVEDEMREILLELCRSDRADDIQRRSPLP